MRPGHFLLLKSSVQIKEKLLTFLILPIIALLALQPTLHGQDKPDLTSAKSKFEMLKKLVSDAKARGIDTKYEDITLTTAGMFLNTFIPWDIAHPGDLEKAFSRWSRKDDLKGTPALESLRAPVWELGQTSEILDQAIGNLTAVLKKPASRRPLPLINTDHLTVTNGFLSADGSPVFSGGFIWGSPEMDKAFSGYIGSDAGFPEFINLSLLQSDGKLSDKTINDIIAHLDAFKALNQKGSIGFGQGALPSWAVAQWPDLDDFKGHFFSYDIDHPQIRGLWKNYIASLVPRIKDHPAVFDYQFAIEPCWPSVGTWMVNNASPYTFQKYQTWLEKLYGNISALNSVWGTSLGSFSEITSRPKDNSNKASWYDWCIFNEWRVTDFFKFMSDEVHKFDPAARCHMRISVGGINAGQYSTSTITGLHNGLDREALVKLYEINALDNFMEAASGRTSRQHSLYDDKAYSIRWLGHTMLLDFIRSLGPGKLIFDSEWHSVSSVYYVNPEPPAGYMHTAQWLSAIHGLGATKTWYWCRNADGSLGRSQEEFYGSLLVQPRLLNEYGVALTELNAFGKEVVAIERSPKQVYLLYSEPAAIQSVEYLDHQMITYEALQFTGVPAGFVTENGLRENGIPSECKLLIVADVSNVKKETVDFLRTYVQKGGRLLVIGNEALKNNEYGKPFLSKDLEFLSSADHLDVVAPALLVAPLEKKLMEANVKRDIACVESSDITKSAFGVICKSAEFNGSHIVCLINVSDTPRDIVLVKEGKKVTKAKDLFRNSSVKTGNIKIQPLQTMLLQL